MSKKNGQNLIKMEVAQHSWGKKLASTYSTIPKGFHAKMTVAEMVNYLQLDPKMIPAQIKNIKVGCFTPEIFADEQLAGFWKTPLALSHIENFPEVAHALKNDQHIPKVQAAAGFKYNPMKPTLETLARMVQTQYLGFNLRLGELTTDSLKQRFYKLQDPENYKKFLALDFVKQHALAGELPTKMPKFSFPPDDVIVKKAESAITKAYERTGSQKDLNIFLENPDKYGVFAVNDMQRTTIIPAGLEDGITLVQRERAFTDLRNIVVVGLMSGELGIVPEEMTDSLHYPPSGEGKDRYPMGIMKGKMRNKGPGDTYFSTFTEVQVGYMPEHMSKTTHALYRMMRDEKDPAEKEKLEAERINLIESFVPKDIKPGRENYIENKEISSKDRLAKMFQGNSADALSSRKARTRAVEVVGAGAVEMDFFQTDRAAVRETLSQMIHALHEDKIPVVYLNTEGMFDSAQKTLPANKFSGYVHN